MKGEGRTKYELVRPSGVLGSNDSRTRSARLIRPSVPRNALGSLPEQWTSFAVRPLCPNGLCLAAPAPGALRTSFLPLRVTPRKPKPGEFRTIFEARGVSHDPHVPPVTYCSSAPGVTGSPDVFDRTNSYVVRSCLFSIGWPLSRRAATRRKVRGGRFPHSRGPARTPIRRRQPGSETPPAPAMRRQLNPPDEPSGAEYGGRTGQTGRPGTPSDRGSS